MVEGIRFGVLLAVFILCFVSVPMHATLNIGGRLGTMTSVTSFFEMVMIGAVIGSVYRRSDARAVSHATAAPRPRETLDRLFEAGQAGFISGHRQV